MKPLPPGWTYATIAELAETIQYGTSAKTSSDSSGIPVLRMGNIVEGRLVLGDLKYLPRDHPEFPKLLLRHGDLLFNRTNSPELVGKTAVYEGAPAQASFASYLLRVQLHSMEPRLLSHYINSTHGRDWVASVVQQQVGQANVNGAKLSALSVPVPPLAEQRRIVAKLDELRARSRRASEALDAVSPLLVELAGSILAAAFRGDLTADWREKNPDTEPAEKLLARTRAERRTKWEEAEFARMKLKGKLPTDERWKEKYRAPEVADVSELSVVPDGWAWASADELCSSDVPIVYGIIQPGDEVESGVPYVRPVDMREDGSIDYDSMKRTSPEIAAQYDRAALRAGDVILSIVGTIGKVVIAPPELEGGNITQSSARLRPPTWMSSDFLRFALLSPALRKQYDAVRFGNAVQRLNVEHVRKLGLPIPPLEEQHVLLDRIRDSLRRLPTAAVEAARERLAALDRALLLKAFRGELVAQDPSDESAQAMLLRVGTDAASPSAQDTPGTKKKKRTKAA